MSEKRRNMSEEIWHGIPRNKIAWGPTINYQKCVSCGKCVDYCKLGVYEFEEKKGTQVSVVKHPNNCVVLCMGCQSQCPANAIRHPSKKATKEIIKNLRKNYPLTKNRKTTGEEQR